MKKVEDDTVLPGQADIFTMFSGEKEIEYISVSDEITHDAEECAAAPVAPVEEDLPFVLDGEAQLSFVDSDEWWKEHWWGMPEFVQNDEGPWKSMQIHFRCREDMVEFAQLIQQRLTNDTRSVWFPIMSNANKISSGWVDEARI